MNPSFKDIFPNRPLMPGVLVVEAIVQTACLSCNKNERDHENPGVSFMTIGQVQV